MYRGPHVSVWFFLLALVLILTAATWCVQATGAAEPTGLPAAAIPMQQHIPTPALQCTTVNADDRPRH